jgi:hypothetical protein
LDYTGVDFERLGERRVEFCAMGSVLKKIKKPPKDVIRDGEGSEL